MKNENFNKKGFGIVEVILAGSIFAVFSAVVVSAIIYGQESSALAGKRARAVLLAEEGLEASRNIRDAAFANLTAGAHGLAVSGNQWTFSGASDATDIFTRQITISSVDADRKQIISNVSWQQTPQRPGLVSLVTYLTNWAGSIGGSWATPFLEASLDLAGPQDGLKIQTEGDYVYLVRNDGTPDFAVINVSNPAAPSLAGSLNLSDAPTNIAIAGNYAYISSNDNSQELQIVNITNPAAPALAGTYDASGNADALGIYAVGTTVYLSRATSADNEFLIINAANPASPALVGSLDLGANGNEIWISGNYAFIASDHNSQELQVINITNPAAPILAGSYDLSGTQNAISINSYGNIVILGRTNNFIYLFDVSTPASPALLNSFNAQGSVNDISIGMAGTFAFSATGSGSAEFQVIDITVPSSPSLFGAINLPDPYNGVAYSAAKDRAFAVSPADGAEFAVFAPQ